MKTLVIAAALAVSVSAFAAPQLQGQAQGQLQGQLQGQQQGQAMGQGQIGINKSNVDTDIKVDASSKNKITTGDVDNSNRIDNKSAGGDAFARGGTAISGSKSQGGDSGGNEINTSTVVDGDEGDHYPVASAIAGQASQCVKAMAAQGASAGISIGDMNSECKAAIAADYFFGLANAFPKDSEDSLMYLDIAKANAMRADPGGFKLGLMNASDMAVSALPIVVIGWALGIPAF